MSENYSPSTGDKAGRFDNAMVSYLKADQQYLFASSVFGSPYRARNSMLRATAAMVGAARLMSGALWRSRSGVPLKGFEHWSQESMKREVDARFNAARRIAELACLSCPLARECGYGPEILISELQDKSARRRFVSRLRPNLGRKAVISERFCASNLLPGRLSKSDV